MTTDGASGVAGDVVGGPWTEEEIADMEADDGRDRLMPLHFRQQVADGMREQNAAARRWAGLLGGEDS